jgi:hypothetical protein
VKSILTDDFLACFARLPDDVKEHARRAYRLWKANPQHPGLQFKRVSNTEPLYSVRIGRNWRALGLLEQGTMTWLWIGSHADYDHLLG